MGVCVYVCKYMCVCEVRDRERDRQTDRDRERQGACVYVCKYMYPFFPADVTDIHSSVHQTTSSAYTYIYRCTSFHLHMHAFLHSHSHTALGITVPGLSLPFVHWALNSNSVMGHAQEGIIFKCFNYH